MHDCYMKFDYVRISLTREKYWYEFRDVLVPTLHALWGIGTNSSRRDIYEVWNLRFNKGPSVHLSIQFTIKKWRKKKHE